MQAAGHLVAGVLAAELTAGVQHGKDDGDGGDAHFGLDVHRDAAAVVGDLDDIALLDGHLDVGAVTGQRLVDGVVNDLVDQVVQAPRPGGADIHAGALADGVQALQDLDLVAAVGMVGDGLAVGFGDVFVRHSVFVLPFCLVDEKTLSIKMKLEYSRNDVWMCFPATACYLADLTVRIFAPQSAAPFRLRLAAHPPPLAGEAFGRLPLWKAPLQGELSPQVTEGCIAAVWGRCPINASATLRDHGFALLRFRQNFTAYRCKLCVDFCIGKPQHINMDGI